MLSFMLDQLELTEEASPTVGANVGLETAVETRVHHQVFLSGEGLPTHLNYLINYTHI